MAQNLFGITDPALMQQAIAQEQEKQLMQRAMLSPAQRQSLYAMRAGQQLGGVVNSLFGNVPVADPRLQQAQLAQEAYQEALSMAGGDASSPQFFESFAQTAAQRNLGQLSQQAANQAQEVLTKQAQQYKDMMAGVASGAQATRERTEAPLTIADRIRLTDLIRQFGDVEGARKFRQERDEAEAKKKDKINIDLGGAMREAASVVEGKEQGRLWAEAGVKYRDTNNVINTLQEFKALAPQAFTGQAAGVKKTFSKLLSAAGIPISDKASNTELLEAFKSQFVQKIAKNFPGSQALKELEQLILSQPNVQQELPTIIRLIDKFTDELLADQVTYNQLSKLPRNERYSVDVNIATVQNSNKIRELRSIEAKVANRTASRAEAERALAIKKELGI
jgi:hypothetical protein